MNAHDEDRMKHLLKQALPPIAGTEPTRDLWLAFLHRVNHDSAQSLPWMWFDCALAGGLVAFLVFIPAWIPVLLYYL